MNGFEFSNNTITIEAAGTVLGGQADTAEIEIMAAHKNLVEFSAKIQRGEAQTSEIEKIIAFTAEKIDSSFGEGSAAKIFAGRTVSIHDCFDLVIYIIGELNRFESGKRRQYESMKDAGAGVIKAAE